MNADRSGNTTDDLQELNFFMQGMDGSREEGRGDFDGHAHTFLDDSTLGTSRRISMSALSTNNSKDKIRKLESEKLSYQEALENHRRSSLVTQENLEREIDELRRNSTATEVRLRRDRDELSESRDELQSQISSLRGEKLSLDQEVSYLRQMLESANNEKRALESRLQSTETMLDRYRSDSSRNIDDLERRLESAEEKSRTASDQSERLQSIVARETELRRNAEDQLEKMDHSMRELLSLNESLVQKMTWGSLEGKDKHMLNQTSSSFRTRSHTRSRSRSRSKTRSKTSSGKRCNSPFNLRNSIHEQLRRANNGDSVPFIVGRSTSPSFNITSSVQSSIENATVLPSARSRSRSPLPRPQHLPSDMDEMLRVVRENNTDMSKITSSLEDEYEDLYRRYEDLLVEAQNSSPLEPASERVTSELRSTIAKLEEKAQQIRVLKTYRSSMQRTLNEALSPPRVRGAEKRQKALRLYHSLKSLERGIPDSN